MLSFIETLNACSAVWFERLVAILWQSTLVAGTVAVLALLLRRSSPALRYWLWQIVAIKLLLMPFWTVAAPLPAFVSELARSSPEGTPTVDLGDLLTVSAPFAAGEAGTAAEFPESELAGPGLTWRSWLLLAWGAVVLGQVGRLARQRRRLGKLLRRATPADAPALRDLVATLAGQLRLRRPPRVLLTDADCSPFVCGLWRPVLVLPRGLLESLDAAQRRQVLLHELAHIRRGDLFWGWFPEVARLLYFFHPVAHWVGVQVRLERELACDQAAMAVSGSNAARYAQTLLQVVSHTSAPAVLQAAGASTAIQQRGTSAGSTALVEGQP